MTPIHLTPAPPAPAARRQKSAPTAFGICLPVPALAAGLSVALPGSSGSRPRPRVIDPALAAPDGKAARR